MKKSKVAAFALLAASLALTACGNDANSKKYTYRTWATALGDKWDPNTWETSADSSLLSYVSEGFVGFAPLDTSKGSWQWTYNLAESVTDVSNAHKDDLVKYGVMEEEPEGDVEGYVYEIKLRKGSMWEEKTYNGKTYGGDEIKADDYVESMKILLDPARKNYRANLYYGGDDKVAGGDLYYYQGSALALDNARDGAPEYLMDDLTLEGGKYIAPTGESVYLAYGLSNVWCNGNSLADYVDAYGDMLFDMDTWDKIVALDENEAGMIDLTPESLALFKDFLVNSTGWGETDLSSLEYYFYVDVVFPEFSWDGVGLYKVDDYTIRYVLAKADDINYFKTHLTSSWLVEPDFYNALTTVDANTGLKTSTYNTSTETTISYGPYKLVSFEDKKQAKFARNENWREYEKAEDGTLTSTTSFKVNGEYQKQYQTTDIVIDVMDQKTAKQAFEKGELNDYTPTPDELVTDYSRSSQLYQVDETYTMSFFFNTNLDALKKMDSEKGNTNSVVLSNYNFRKAFSLAIDRADWVTNTEGYKPAYALLNTLYYYDVYNNPESVYRYTDQAMKAVVDLYGIEYGEGKTYKTLKEAYDSVTGYNLTEAKSLMKTAYEELLAAGLINAGANVHIKVAYKKGSLEAAEQAQIAAMNKYLAAACEGSGFGTVDLEAVGNITDRYGDVPKGEYAIGYGAWGGAAFYPFTNLQVYMDPDKYEINEAGCWDPTRETKTILIGGEEVTMTYQKWANSMSASGQYANADFEVKLDILSNLEEDFLNKYYRIPLAGSTSCFLLGYQQEYFTQNYNIMYDFGGLQLMTYKYNDAEWASYVKSQGGTLNYK